MKYNILALSVSNSEDGKPILNVLFRNEYGKLVIFPHLSRSDYTFDRITFIKFNDNSIEFDEPQRNIFGTHPYSNLKEIRLKESTLETIVL
jgi:hypothetical protein